MKRQIDEYYLKEFRKLLETSTREKLINYFDTYIINAQIDDIAGLKRAIYLLMTETFKDNPEINKKYYDLYQNLKNKNISYDEAIKVYSSILNVN